jgi:hypothetical protein
MQERGFGAPFLPVYLPLNTEFSAITIPQWPKQYPAAVKIIRCGTMS